MATPSNSTLTRFCFQLGGAVNVFRYHATPAGKYPPPDPVGFFSLGASSMLQSCGKSTVRQSESLNDGASALAGSPRKNFQLESTTSCCRGDGGWAAQTGADERRSA